MKNKKLIVGIIVVIAVIAGFMFLMKHAASKSKTPSKSVPAGKAIKTKTQPPAKKTFSKGMGGLTVKIADSKGKEMPVRIGAYRCVDANSSIAITTFQSNKMQELSPGNYDIVVDAVPAKIYKNISVSKEKETVEDLATLTGSLNIKAQNAKKKDAYYPVRVLYPGTPTVVCGTMTNKALEIVPGIYDIEVGGLLKQSKNGVKVESGKETLIDLGCTTGMLTVKAVDENNKPARYTINVRKAENNELVVSDKTNRAFEIPQGNYRVDIASSPVQSKSGVVINAGEEAVVEFAVQTPPPAAKPAAIPAKPKR